MTDAQGYVRRADQAQRRAMECLEKIGFKPHSRAAYEMQHDWALTDMYFYDALSRAAVRDPDDLAREMRAFQALISTQPPASHAIDKGRFLDQLKHLVSVFLEQGET